MADKKQYQGKKNQASDAYMEAVEREITCGIIDGTIVIARDDNPKKD